MTVVVQVKMHVSAIIVTCYRLVLSGADLGFRVYVFKIFKSQKIFGA